MLRIERHPLGPRVYVFRARVHEWHLGVAVLVALGAAALLDHAGRSFGTLAVGTAGVLLIAKDWRDLVPSKRDTATWRLGLHMEPAPLRTMYRADPLPKLVALTAALAGLVNLAAAVRPNIAWRNHLLLGVEPLEGLKLSHAAAVPISLLLLVSSPYLWRRRQSALRLGLALLAGLTALDLLKGLDVEAASGSAAAVTVLWLGRGSFYVRHDPDTLRVELRRVPLLAGTVALLCGLAVWLAGHGDVGLVTVARETGDAFLWQQGPMHFRDELAHLDEAIGLSGLVALAWCAYLLFRPLAAPRSLPDAEGRRAAGALVRSHGSDTLAYFKLRHDQHYLFGHARRAFLGYRVEAGVLLVSGDPVGPAEALPDLLRTLSAFASARGLRVAALGVGERMVPLWEDLGLRSIYIGDEAIVETASFSLEGRAIRKVRQSVSRLAKHGYTAHLQRLSELSDRELAELAAVSHGWRQGKQERGFAMSLDELRKEDHGDSVVVVGRDADGQTRGFLHFAPSYGRPAASLSLMRRDRDTPNGLTEFLVARGLELLRDEGVEEVSLNFAAFARFIHAPRNRVERLTGRVLLAADAVFQIERLYRFNAKFFPRWEPRYLMHESLPALPRVALAAMWIEGQLPKPRLP